MNATCSPPDEYIGSTTEIVYDDIEKTVGTGCDGGGDEVSIYHVVVANVRGESDPSNEDGACTEPSNKQTLPQPGLPQHFALHGNFPNPFNPSTEIRFDMPERTWVSLVVYDALGREVARLIDGRLEAGRHPVPRNASGMSSGVYVYRFTAGDFSETLRMVLLK